jgi:hypothetical protein
MARLRTSTVVYSIIRQRNAKIIALSVGPNIRLVFQVLHPEKFAKGTKHAFIYRSEWRIIAYTGRV